MKNWLDEIDSRFPVRCSEPQKEAFRAYVLEEAGKLGCSASVETQGCTGAAKAHRNLVIGDPQTARTVFTAHYDTPRRSLLPNLLLPLNVVLKYVTVFLPLFVLVAVALGAAFGLRALTGLQGTAGRALTVVVYGAVYFGLFMLLYHGPANRHNRNDNTSGTAAVLSLAERLAGVPGAAFILFDNEEKGKKGSKAYAQYRPEVKSGRLVVNLDCVGSGEQFIVSVPEAAANDACYPALSAALESIGARICSSREARMNSDHRNFDKGVGICACSYRKGLGWYTGRIHTAKDTIASPENIEKLAGALAAFARQE